MGNMIHNGYARSISFGKKIKKKCKLKHNADDADMCGDYIRLNGINPFADTEEEILNYKPKRKKARKNGR